MTLKFRYVTIHHFLSFDHAKVDFSEKGYCLVSGINKNPKDFAKSNGAGKSTIFNAISFALTGETLQGLKSDLANNYFNDGCYVELEFDVDNHRYKLLRSKDDATYGTNLKIYVDDEDKSGKGIRDSNDLLSQYLPDLTSELIGSTILIGQGMPMKFTSNSPSGRKEVLEHLSQSDFMIQDIKDRINKRVNVINTLIREIEDKTLELTTKKNVYTQQLDNAKKEFEDKFTNPINFDDTLRDLNKQKESLDNDIKEYQEIFKQLSEDLKRENERLASLSKERSDLRNKYFEEHQEATKEFNEELGKINGKILALKSEIQKIKDIKDVCPLCGQKIPNVVKKDTTTQEELLDKYQKDLENLNLEIKEDNSCYQEVLQKIDNKFNANIEMSQSAINTYNSKIRVILDSTSQTQNSLQRITREINETSSARELFTSNKQRVIDTIANLEKELTAIEKDKKNCDVEKSNLDEHSEVLTKMSTIVKRDFRGFLLKNIIDYIDAKAKEYASQIFGCNEIAFELDGNDINISFCNKNYDNLSGGEKQRVDLIVEFAIRNFMCQYLNFSSNILVLDEIFDALDSESCDRVINFITNELKDIESVFIISHHSDSLDIPYDSQLIIEKNDLGVSHVVF